MVAFQKALGYSFRNQLLLNSAFTHKSYANEKSENLKNNERFEFLGDSVLDLVVSDYTIRHFQDYSEGTLSKVRAAVVNEQCLAGLARQLDIGNYLLLGKGEEQSGGRDKTSILADAFEAIVGAVYFDGGMDSAMKVFLPLLLDDIQKFAVRNSFWDCKSELQEFTQNRMNCIPSYRIFRESGPDHNKTFHVEVLINNKSFGVGIGKSKKEAEQAAAKDAMSRHFSN